MSFTKEMHIYEANVDFNVPLAASPNKHVELKTGDTIITIGTTVYVEYKNKPDNAIGNFTEALFKKGFIDINPTIFKQKL